ncbi:MAG: translocation/assembly module TamB domain-containing protein [Chitinispirillaceae bacterium]
MKHTLKIIALILVVLVLTLLGTVLAALKVNAVHQFAISRINAEIPGTLSLGRLRIFIFDTRVEILDFALDDSSGKRLARFDNLTVDMSSLALLRNNYVVENAELENPEIILQMDSGGELSLVKALGLNQKPAQKKQTTPPDTSKPFPLEIQNLVLENANLQFTTPKDDLDIEALGITVKGKGNTISPFAEMHLALDSASVERGGEYLPVESLSLVARMLQMNLDTLDLELSTGSSSLTIRGSADSLASNPVLNIASTADFDLWEIAAVAGLKEQISGMTKFGMNIKGPLADPNLNLDLTYNGGAYGEYPVDTLFLKALLKDRVLTVAPLHLIAENGNLDVNGRVDMRQVFPEGLLDTPSSPHHLRYDLAVSGKSIPLTDITPGLSGTAAVSLSLDGQGIDPDSMEAKLHASADMASFKLKNSPIPADAEVTCSAAVSKGKALVHLLTGSLGEASVLLKGEYGISSERIDADVNVSAPDLSKVLTFAGIDKTSGSTQIDASIAGNILNPQARINLDASTIQHDSIRIGDVSLLADLSNGTAYVDSLAVENSNSSLHASGQARILDNGTFVPVEKMFFSLNLSSPSLALEDFMNSVKGRVALDADVKGTVENPNGYVKLSASDLVAGGQTISEVDFDARLDQQRMNIVSSSVLVAPGEKLNITGWASIKDSFSIALSSPGISLTTINALKSQGPVNGIFSIDVQAEGTYSDPDAAGQLAVTDILYEDKPLDDLNLDFRLKNEQITLDGNVGGNLQASYNLESRFFTADLEFDNFTLTPYLALSGQQLEGILTAALSASGSIDSLSTVIADLNLNQLRLGYQNKRIVEARLHGSLKDGNYSIPDISLTMDEGGFLSGNAQGNLKNIHEIALKGDIPLSVAQNFTTDLDEIEGNVRINGVMKKIPHQTDLSAQLFLSDIGLTLPGLSQRLHSLNGQILADQSGIRVAQLRGNLEDGVFNMNGNMNLVDFAPSDINADINFEALPVSVPDMLDLVLDAELRVGGTPDTTRVEGDVTLLDGLYYQDVEINPFAGIGKRTRELPAPSPEITFPYLRNMIFDIAVKAQSPFRVDNNLAKLTIAPDLMLRGTLENPSLNGRANVEEGTISYVGRTFSVQRGVVDFVDPYSIEPEIDILGSVSVEERTIRVLANGELDDLRFQLSSDDPTLADQDLLSLLVLGKTTAELQGEGESEEKEQTNQQIIASLIASTLGEEIKTATGLDTLSVETGDEDDQDSDRIALTLGKSITNRLNTLYTVESEDGEIVQRATAEYRLFNNLSITGFRNTRGIYGGELRLIWELR